jgi:hypothetical protein
MPDISKLSGALIDSVGKVDGVLKESIASIVGLTVPSSGAYTPPLDTYTGATAAYSVRKLSSTYSGSCIEAYRVSDGATQDIGFDADGLIDTAAIIAFASGGEVRVQTWYDQSGQSNHATQATTGLRPQIYDGAAVVTQNEKPAIYHSLTTGQPLVVSSFTGGASAGTIVGVLANIADTGIPWLSYGTGAPYFLRTNSGGTNSAFRALGTVTAHINGVTDTSYTQGESYNDFNTSQGLMFLDCDTSATTNANFEINHSDPGYWQELIFWDTDQDGAGNRTGIEINLNDYYQIANLPATTSGLLYDYPGAAAAYSVRSLSNNAVKCMRVKRSVPPYDEQDIGFDSNGELDTAAISAFGGSDPLTVSAWYDQSGEQVHATQGTATAQPQIYNGTAVITENGKPAVQFDGVDDTLAVSVSFSHAGHTYTVGSGEGNSLEFGLCMGGASSERFETVFDQRSSPKRHTVVVDTSTNYVDLDSQATVGQQYLLNNSNDSGTIRGYVDGVEQSTTITGYSALSINAIRLAEFPGGGGFRYGQVNLQEAIIYNVAGHSNRTGIEGNINAYYSIY